MLDREEVIGSGENFEEDADTEDRRRNLERAAAAGDDELAGVLAQQIEGLAEEFAARTQSIVDNALGAVPGVPVQPPRQFVFGAVFGAIVFFVGVLVGSRK